MDYHGCQVWYHHHGTADRPGHRGIGSADRLCGRYVPDFREKIKGTACGRHYCRYRRPVHRHGHDERCHGSPAGFRDLHPYGDQVFQPLLGILVGAVFTAIIQSSSASVGILQALAMGGVINLHSAVFVLFGQNIGTCITALLASVGTSRNAKRTTLIHLMFNVIGTALFVTLCILTPFTDFVVSLTPDNPVAQIANVHTIFNISTTLILLPFGALWRRLPLPFFRIRQFL